MEKEDGNSSGNQTSNKWEIMQRNLIFNLSDIILHPPLAIPIYSKSFFYLSFYYKSAFFYLNVLDSYLKVGLNFFKYQIS